jgi:ABC-2 type transport system permease protein
VARYLRIFWCFARNGLVREMTFRTNFIITVASEVLWLGMMLVFVGVIYRNTDRIEGWSGHQYLFLMGTHFLVTGIFETLFFGNAQRFSELIRTGGLDFVLLKPVSTQFFVSMERVDYTAVANALLGIGLCVYAGGKLEIAVTPGGVALFVLLLGSGVVTLYALMFIFTATSVWMIRQTSASHFWFYLTGCARYPAEIYQPLARGGLWLVLTFVLPVLIVANLPANVMVRSFTPGMIAYAVVIAVVILLVSRRVFSFALRSYRSASS